MPVFLYGPLCWEPLAAQVLGDEFLTLTRENAHLPGYALHASASHWWPQICAKEGRVAGEIMQGLSSEAHERLAFLAKGLGLELEKVVIDHNNQMLEATCLLPTPCGSTPPPPLAV